MHKQGNINGYQKNNSLMALGILLQVSKPKTYNFKNPNLSKKSMLLKLVIKKPKKKKKILKLLKMVLRCQQCWKGCLSTLRPLESLRTRLSVNLNARVLLL